jgi:hypothetical protein
VEPVAAVAVRVTRSPWSKAALHVLPQAMPVGLEITVPAAVTGLVTVRLYVTAAILDTNASIPP